MLRLRGQECHRQKKGPAEWLGMLLLLLQPLLLGPSLVLLVVVTRSCCVTAPLLHGRGLRVS